MLVTDSSMTLSREDNDVFDEEAEEMDLEAKQWTKLKSYRLKDGFRDGITEGQDNSLQESFNEGFKNGFNATYSISMLCGILRTFCLNDVDNISALEIYNELRLLENSVLKLLKTSVYKKANPNVLKDVSSQFRLEETSSQFPIEENIVQSENATPLMNTSKIEEPVTDTGKMEEVNTKFSELKGKCLNLAERHKLRTLASIISSIDFYINCV